MPTDQEVRKQVFQSLPVGRMIFGVVLFVAVLGVLAYTASFFLGRRLSRWQGSAEAAPNELLRRDLSLGLPQMVFKDFGAQEIAPADSSLYLVASDFILFSPWFEGHAGLAKVSSAVKPFFAEASEVSLSDSFAVLQRGEDLALVFKLVNREEASARFEQLALEEGWGSFFVGDYLLFSNSETYVEDIGRSFKKRSLPLSLSSSFQQVVLDLPTSGEVLLYLPLRGKKGEVTTLETSLFHFVPEGLKGNGFVLSTQPEGVRVTGVSHD